MTVYEQQLTSYWTVETPLNEQFEYEPKIIIGEEDLAQDPIQRRMMMILVFVLVGALLFAILVMPRLASANLPLISHAAEGSTNMVAAEQSGGQTVAYFGQISPVFSNEVKYWEADIVRWATDHNLDPDMVATIMQIESCGDPKALSSAGAQGLFQVMPFHFSNGENMLDPDTNAMRGMNYFAERLVQTSGDVGKAFAGYNGGHVAAGTSWDNWAAETQRYFVWATGIYEDAKAGLTESPTLQQWYAAGGTSLCQQASSRLNLQ
ncbi:MAG: transglycosylase SLT domain-containing protein [Anaerolineales bacterium]|nr:transglycosylase SLT domain-containing protein [Anaerolineales bacterium]MCB8938146.1 transglycosylase SLT domain-containing protein [Ardenticatenaceae bacterium]